MIKNAPEEPVYVSGAVEGPLDEAVLRRLVLHVGANPARVYAKAGKRNLLRSLRGYNQAARFSPWLVLVDLDDDFECAPPSRQFWLPHPGRHMCFRVVVREIESWLLADAERAASFLRVSVNRVPHNPDEVQNPKEVMIRLAAASRSKEIREDMVPRPGSGRAVGPAYSSRLIEFVVHSPAPWRPEVAARASDSLRRCLTSLRTLVRQ